MKNAVHSFVALGAALAAILVAAPSAVAQQKTFTLRLNHVLGPNEPFHRGFQDWAKRVDERT